MNNFLLWWIKDVVNKFNDNSLADDGITTSSNK